VIGATDMEYLIRVNYKSGKIEEFWVKKFSYTKDSRGIRFNWTASSIGVGPIYIGTDEIESVWKVGARNAKEI
jgi:hypothetical protein